MEMYILAPGSSYDGSIHTASCRVFEKISGIQRYLSNVERTWDAFSVSPTVFVVGEKGIKRLTDEEHRDKIYPYTLNSRRRNAK